MLYVYILLLILIKLCRLRSFIPHLDEIFVHFPKRASCVLCSSIFRVFSADRKRVENALEICGLPSGRVSPALCHVNAAGFVYWHWDTVMCKCVIIWLQCSASNLQKHNYIMMLILCVILNSVPLINPYKCFCLWCCHKLCRWAHS